MKLIINTTEMVEKVTTEPKEFTQQQKERYNSLVGIYGEENAGIIVRNLKLRGQNAFASVYQKALKLSKLSDQMRRYYEALDEALDEVPMLTEDELIQTVSEFRSAHEQPPFVTKIKAQSLIEFQSLFIYEEIVQTGDEGNKVKEYKIICRLMP